MAKYLNTESLLASLSEDLPTASMSKDKDLYWHMAFADTPEELRFVTDYDGPDEPEEPREASIMHMANVLGKSYEEMCDGMHTTLHSKQTRKLNAMTPDTPEMRVQ